MSETMVWDFIIFMLGFLTGNILVRVFSAKVDENQTGFRSDCVNPQSITERPTPPKPL